MAALLATAACQRSPEPQSDGQRLFQSACVRCHAADGTGDPVQKVRLGVPDMTDPAWQRFRTDEDIKRVIRQGSESRKMPPFGMAFRDEHLDALVRHVRSLNQEPPLDSGRPPAPP